MKYVAATLLLVAASAFLVSSQFVCPEEEGQFMDDSQCDKYYICTDGIAEEMLCEDGLVFDPFKKSEHKCDLPSLVDCDGREQLQPARPIGNCPRRNGMFEHPDSTRCNMMLSCIEGEENYFTCPGELVFDASTGDCTWPENAVDKECRTVTRVLADGFQCPVNSQFTEAGDLEAHPRYPHADCQKFYVCVEGKVPRAQSCGVDQLFNPETHLCDDADNVFTCGADYIAESNQ